MTLVIIFLVIAQILSIIVSTYLLLLERKYCQHLDYWWDGGAWLFFIISLIPFIGLLTSIGGCADYTRNIVEQLNKEVKQSKTELEKYSASYNETKRLYESQQKSVKTLSANCITQNRGVSEAEGDLMARECLCGELAKQLLPYVEFEKYLIADQYNNEIKHVGTVKVVGK